MWAVKHKANGVSRAIAVRWFSEKLRYLVICEYPKSGATWLGGMLEGATGLPFPKNTLAPLRPAIVPTHRLEKPASRKYIVLWRDPRDILISEFFYSTVVNDRNNGYLVRSFLKAYPELDREDSIEAVKRFFSIKSKEKGHRQWLNFAQTFYCASGACHITYEALRTDPAAELARVLSYLNIPIEEKEIARIVLSHGFASMSGRSPGDEQPGAFLRKGVVGDWKSYLIGDFEREVSDFYSPWLARLGYS